MLRVIHSHVLRQLLDGLLGERHALVARELEQRGGPQRPVKVTMQLGLRQLPKLVREDRKWHQSELSSVSSAVCRARTTRKIAPLCTAASAVIGMPRLSVISRSPLRIAAACVESHCSTASNAVAVATTSTGLALM